MKDKQSFWRLLISKWSGRKDLNRVFPQKNLQISLLGEAKREILNFFRGNWKNLNTKCIYQIRLFCTVRFQIFFPFFSLEELSKTWLITNFRRRLLPSFLLPNKKEHFLEILSVIYCLRERNGLLFISTKRNREISSKSFFLN